MFIKKSLIFILLCSLSQTKLFAEANKKFTNLAAVSNFLDYYLTEKTTKKAFTKRTLARDVKVKIKVPSYILSEIFADLNKAVFLANKYAKQKYEIELIENKFNDKYVCYGAFDGYKTDAEIYPLFEKTNNPSHFKYFCRGTYKTAIPIKGFFFMDVKIKSVGAYSQLEVQSYFHLASLFLSSIIYDLRSYKSFREKMNKIIDATIKNMISVGRVTSLRYFREKKKNKQNDRKNK